MADVGASYFFFEGMSVEQFLFSCEEVTASVAGHPGKPGSPCVVVKRVTHELQGSLTL